MLVKFCWRSSFFDSDHIREATIRCICNSSYCSMWTKYFDV